MTPTIKSNNKVENEIQKTEESKLEPPSKK